MEYLSFLNIPVVPKVVRKNIRKNNDLAEQWISSLNIDFKDDSSLNMAINKLSSEGFSLSNVPKSEILSLVLILSCNE